MIVKNGNTSQLYTTGANLTFAYTVNASSNLLVVCIMHRADYDVTSVTYAGAALTKHATATNVDQENASIWYKVGPATGANNIVVTPPAGGLDFRCAVADFSGVDAASPTNTKDEQTGATDASLTLTNPTDNCLAIACIAHESSSSPTLPGGFDAISNNDEGTWVTSAVYKVYSGDPGSPTIAWAGTDDQWAGVAVSFNANAAPTVALGTPADNATISDTTPDLTFTGTDANADPVSYQVQVDTATSFDSAAIDEYSLSNRDGGFAISGGATFKGFGESFTGNGHQLTSVSLVLYRFDAILSGNATIEIYAHSGVYGTSSVPTGSALASATYDVSSLTTSPTTVTIPFTGSNQIILTNGTYYVLAIKYSGGDAENYLMVGDDSSSPGHDGNGCRWNGTVWDSDTPADMVFRLPVAMIDTLSTDLTGFTSDADGFYASGTEVTYTVQSALTGAGPFYWRVRAKDPAGSNEWGAWSPGDSTLGYDHFHISGGTDISTSVVVHSLTTSQPTPTVSTIQNLTASATIQTGTLSQPSPTITASRNISTSTDTQAATLSLADPTISTQAVVNVAVDALVQTLTHSQADPAITVTRNETIAPNTESLTSSQPSPTVTTVRNITTEALPQSLTASAPLPQVSAIQNTTILASAGVLTYSQATPGIETTSNTLITPAVQSATFTAPDVVITAVRNESVSVNAQLSSVSLPDLSVLAVRNETLTLPAQSITLSPATSSVSGSASTTTDIQALSSSQPDPTVSTVQNLTVLVNSQSLTYSQPSPSIAAGGSIDVGPAPQAGQFSQPVPTISTTTNVAVQQDVLETALSCPTPTVSTSTGITVVASVQSATLTPPEATITTVRNIAVESAVQVASFSQATPDVSISGELTFIPNCQQATLSLPSPTIVAVCNESVSTDIQNLTVSQLVSVASAVRNILLSLDAQSATSSQPVPTISTTRNTTTDISDAPTLSLSQVTPTVSAVRNVSFILSSQSISFSQPSIIIAGPWDSVSGVSTEWSDEASDAALWTDTAGESTEWSSLAEVSSTWTDTADRSTIWS